MGSVRILFCVLCFAAIVGGRVFSSGVVGYGTGRNESRSNYSGDDEKEAGRGPGAVISAAQKEVGVREDSENAGKRVDEYCAYVGVKKVAWCAAFVSWCFGQAGYTQPKTAWSPALFPKGRLRKEPLPGMVMGIYFPSMGRIAHCGIVESLRGDFIVSIEGNTKSGDCRVAAHPRNDDREGDGVYRRMRHKRSIANFSEW